MRTPAAAAAAAALLFYGILAWDVGADALDSDTTSLLAGWKLIRNGEILERWSLAAPKFLPVVLDGALYELAGFRAVLARSLLAGIVIAAAGAAFTARCSGRIPGLLAAGLLLLHGQIVTLTFGANSTILGAAFLMAALLSFRWYPQRAPVLGGLAMLFCAALARTELISYLVIACALLAWLGWRERAQQRYAWAGAAAALAGGAFLLDAYVPSKLTGEWTTSREVAQQLASNIDEQIEARKKQGLGADYRLRRHESLERSYLSNLGTLFWNLLRPLPLLAITGLAGLAALWRRSRKEAVLLLVFGAAPLVYGWVIFQQGGALVHRFFLPATLACLVTSAAAFGLAWERVSRFSLGPRKLLRISLALLATGVLAVGARDVYYAKIGYLDSVTSSLRQFRQGLRTIEDQDLRNKRILVYGWHWGYANLVLRTGPNTVYRDEILLTTPDPRRFLCECAYVLIRRGNPFVDQLIEQASQGEGDRCLESFWSSPSGEFELFRRAHAGVR